MTIELCIRADTKDLSIKRTGRGQGAAMLYHRIQIFCLGQGLDQGKCHIVAC